MRWIDSSFAPKTCITNDLHVGIATSLHQSSLLTLPFSGRVHLLSGVNTRRPRRAKRDRSRLNLPSNHCTSEPLFSHKTLASSGFFAAPFKVSDVNLSSNNTLPPSSKTVLAANIPAKPPPTTMDWSGRDAIEAKMDAGQASKSWSISNLTRTVKKTTECTCDVLLCVLCVVCCGYCVLSVVVYCVCCVLSLVCVVFVVQHWKKTKRNNFIG